MDLLALSATETVPGLLIAVFGTARLTRIIAYDDYPPSEWLRARWVALVGDSWGKLLTCIWCAQPYVAAGCVTWGVLSGLHEPWWWFWGILALSQAGSIVLSYDEPE